MATPTLLHSPDTPVDAPSAADRSAVLERLERAFRQTFAVVDASRGVLERVTHDWPRVDVFRWLGLCEHVAERGRVEVIEEHAPLLLLAVPLPAEELASPRVAVAVLLTEGSPSDAAIASAADAFGVDPKRLAAWSAGRRAWPAYAAEPLAQGLIEAAAAERAASSAKSQLAEMSSQLLATFEELHLLHRIADGLTLGRGEADLLEQAATWLGEIVPAEAIVAQMGGQPPIARGRVPRMESEGFESLFAALGPQAQRRTLVLNRDRTSSPTWPHAGVREVVSAPIVANGESVGWVAAINYAAPHRQVEGTFGSVEASLLSSVATLIGVHTGNRSLFDERRRLFESTVHALISAVDAKDRYTCGHSDRVARIAVRLAQQLGCSADELNTIYLGGLLHDIGKIGVDDAVLRKEESLTPEEFDQIKLHPTLGERILRGLPQLAGVLPIVLHHHEAWDGRGYPGALVGPATPLLARIVAVADAYDAMGSDRPYRKGMPPERVESILRDGAGGQWDPAVVDAYFAAREDIAAISRVEREPLDLDVSRWRAED